MKILVLNSGSSSLKYQVIDMDTETVLAKGNYERIGQDTSFLTHKANGEKNVFEHAVPSHKEAISFVIEKLLSKEYGVISSLDEVNAIGHRVAHGTDIFDKSVLITFSKYPIESSEQSSTPTLIFPGHPPLTIR